VTDDTFAAKIPEGYNRLKIMRHATIDDPKVEAAEADLPRAEPATKTLPK
jgi:hypothetical protein